MVVDAVGHEVGTGERRDDDRRNAHSVDVERTGGVTWQQQGRDVIGRDRRRWRNVVEETTVFIVGQEQG